jgi:cation:H+ antiporter
MDIVIFIASMGALIYGADFIIKESERIALHFNISHFVIGATLVALGTSLPEMAASISANFKGSSDMAVSNVVGSNIFNICLILSIVFMIGKNIKPKRDIFAKDSTWAILPVFIFILMGIDNSISRFDGAILLILMLAYVLFLMSDSKNEIEVDEDLLKEPFKWAKTIALLLIGFVFVIVGADFAIESATNIARAFGVSEWIIGMFLISFGTSLPELVVSISAAKKGNADMSIGNIIGSNVANITVVLGSASLIAPIKVDFMATYFDILALVLISLSLVFITANKMYNKASGVILFSFLLLIIQNSLRSL